MKYLTERVIITLLILASSLAGFGIYMHNTRYSLRVAGNQVYKLDRTTGEVWRIYGQEARPVKNMGWRPSQ